MKVSELSGAVLNYWVARAKGIPADQLEIRRVPQTDWTFCTRWLKNAEGRTCSQATMDYTENWDLTGPLVDEHMMSVISSDHGRHWSASTGPANMAEHGSGPTALIAICRAVVRYQFGDQVEDLPEPERELTWEQ